MSTLYVAPQRPERMLTLELRNLPQCTCTHVDTLRARITEYHGLLNIILNLDRKRYDKEKARCDTTDAFERDYLIPLYSTLQEVANLVNFRRLEPLENAAEGKFIRELEYIDAEDFVTDITEGVATAHEGLRKLATTMAQFRERNAIPAAMTNSRIDRLKQAIGMVASFHEGRKKVDHMFCIFHAFYVDGDRNASESSASRAEGDTYKSRSERVGSCSICKGTVTLNGTGNKRSVVGSICRDKFPKVRFRAWDKRDPLGDRNEPIWPLSDVADTLGDNWFEATMVIQTGEFSMVHSQSGQGIARFCETDSQAAFEAFVAPVSRSLHQTLKGDLRRHQETLSY
jgi:hypothetical protein